ncbi:MAG: hypothetical protein K2Y27_11355 [Xanthobacteraceae bacterium]|nr:hypothetical protein [Xanthobacteraceae bacterium]
MSFDRVRCGIAAGLFAVCAAFPAGADTFPSRPIRLIVPTQAGAAQDVIARLLRPHLEKSLGQPVVVAGLLTTSGTPKEIVAKINTEVNRALRDPELIAKLAQQGTTAAGGSPEEFRKLIATEIRNWKETAERAGLKVQ